MNMVCKLCFTTLKEFMPNKFDFQMLSISVLNVLRIQFKALVLRFSFPVKDIEQILRFSKCIFILSNIVIEITR